MKTQPNTWIELLNAGYVLELDECQIAEAKEKLGTLTLPTGYTLDFDEQNAKNHEAESKMRGL